MKSISMTDVRLHLSEIIEEMSPGEELMIEKRGFQIAKLVLLSQETSNHKSLAGSFRHYLTKDIHEDEDFEHALDGKDLKLTRGLE